MASEENDPVVRAELTEVEDALRAAGSPSTDLIYMANTRKSYPAAIPVFIEWLPRVKTLAIRETIVRALTVKEARRRAEKVIVAEFDRTLNEPVSGKDGYLWAIGNALRHLASPALANEIRHFLGNSGSGTARKMLCLAAAKAKDQKAIPTLLDLLDSYDIMPFAAAALASLRAHEAIPKLKAIYLAGGHNSWVRRELRNALRRLGVNEPIDAVH